MIRFAFTLLLTLTPMAARADVVAYYATGQSLYVRFDDGSNTAVNLTEGGSLKLGRYVAADAAIDAAGLAAGTYSARILVGTAGTQSPGDVEVSIVPEFVFGASTQIVNAPQTGDSFARIGASGGGLTALASQASLNSVAVTTTDIQSDISTLNIQVDSIQLDTAQIGLAGVGLTALASSAAVSGLDAKLGAPAVTLAADIAAKPSAAQVRTEMDANSTKLASINANASTAATQSTAAATSASTAATQSTTAATRVTTALPDAAPGASTGLPRVSDLPEEGGGGGVVIPVNQVPVPPARTWTLVQTSQGLLGDRKLYMSLTDDAKTFAVDFHKDLSTNGRLEDYVSITPSDDGIEISELEADLGVDKTQVKFKVSPLEAGTYTIAAIAEYGESDGGGESTGRVILVVLP